MSTKDFLTDEEINALVQYEAGNNEYFQLTQSEAERIKSVIEMSDLYRQKYEDSRKVYQEVHTVVTKKTQPNTFGIAAAIALFLMGSLVLFNINWNGLTSRTLTQAELASPGFQINTELENYVNYPMRSSMVSTVQPEIGSVLSGSIVFEIDTRQRERLSLKILNNEQVVVFQDDLSAQPFLMEQDLTPGLYYWSVENEQEIIYWGKFYYK